MQTVVEQIKDRLPITDVLSSYITITQAGKQYKAKCPFHNEKTASFSISPDRGLYYCFGCGAKGDIFTFVQQFEGVDFNGSLKILADRAGVELREHDRHRDDTDPLYVLLEKTTQRFQNELQKNTEALRYLKGRGVTEQTIADFRLGYAPQNGDLLPIPARPMLIDQLLFVRDLSKILMAIVPANKRDRMIGFVEESCFRSLIRVGEWLVFLDVCFRSKNTKKGLQQLLSI